MTGSSRRALLGLAALLLTAGTALADDPADTPAPPTAAAPAAARVAPVELKIPSLGVDANVEPVGAADDGAMDVPKDPDGVAWWSLGYGTGEPGNVVLAGHVDWGGRLRVFGRLSQLQNGEQIVLIDERAREYFYEVTSLRQVEAEGADVDAIFGGSGQSELTLITCGGAFDPAQRMYVDRIIVRARLT